MTEADPDAPDPRVSDAGAPAEQFQRAALDAIRAARAMLDAAEAVVADPKVIDSFVHTVTAMARSTGETVVGFATGMAAERAQPTAGPGEDHEEGGDGGYERIVVD